MQTGQVDACLYCVLYLPPSFVWPPLQALSIFKYPVCVQRRSCYQGVFIMWLATNSHCRDRWNTHTGCTVCGGGSYRLIRTLWVILRSRSHNRCLTFVSEKSLEAPTPMLCLWKDPKQVPYVTSMFGFALLEYVMAWCMDAEDRQVFVVRLVMQSSSVRWRITLSTLLPEHLF